jgi:hypothetical protein
VECLWKHRRLRGGHRSVGMVFHGLLG